LASLDGIGPALAGRILEYRRQHGGFSSLDELKEVSGIGDKRFEALRKSLVP
jgi:competence protein ComEA